MLEIEPNFLEKYHHMTFPQNPVPLRKMSAATPPYVPIRNFRASVVCPLHVHQHVNGNTGGGEELY